MTKSWMIAIISFVILIVIAYSQLTIFVVQPIGAVPEGRTLVILRLNKTNFIDSADAFCQREMGGVNLLCRAGALGQILDKTKILLRLPYSESLYLVSTNGKKYDR